MGADDKFGSHSHGGEACFPCHGDRYFGINNVDSLGGRGRPLQRNCRCVIVGVIQFRSIGSGMVLGNMPHVQMGNAGGVMMIEILRMVVRKGRL